MEADQKAKRTNGRKLLETRSRKSTKVRESDYASGNGGTTRKSEE